MATRIRLTEETRSVPVQGDGSGSRCGSQKAGEDGTGASGEKRVRRLIWIGHDRDRLRTALTLALGHEVEGEWFWIERAD